MQFIPDLNNLFWRGYRTKLDLRSCSEQRDGTGFHVKVEMITEKVALANNEIFA